MSAPASPSAAVMIEPLTRREREILALLAQSLSAPEIARQLNLAVSSVKSHIQHIYGKLGVNSRRAAIARARELDLSPLAQAALAPTGPSLARHNLPQQLTRLIGREREMSAIRQLLADGQPPAARLVTLVGPGGSGKTRLSLAIAADALAAYRDGVWLVEVAALADAELLASTVAASLGLRLETASVNPNPEAVRPPLAVLTDFVQTKQCLLVLDNCEHLVEACARLAEALLRAAPRLQILATSREALGVTGETIWPVPGLALPPGVLPVGVAAEQAAEYAAVQLFAERARSARPGFCVTAQNADCLTQVCRQLDGLPLAIELAAARVSLLPVEQIASLLAAHERFRLLTGGGRTALPRHQTLLATIEWSYQLLSERERAMLRRLPVFAGGWTLAAAEVVCADPAAPAAGTESMLPPGDVLEALVQLAAKSLVVSEPNQGVEARFHLLETIREFAAGKLEQSGEAAALRQRHFDFFLALAEQAEPELRGPEQLAWLDRLEADHDNLRRALDWAIESRSAEAGVRLASALHRFWYVRGHATEALAWFNRLVAGGPPPRPSANWALGLARAAYFARCATVGVDATAYCQASLDLSRELGAAGQTSKAYALLELNWIKRRDNAPETAALPQESLTLFVQAGDNWGQAMALRDIGFAAKMAGDYPQALAAFENSRTLFDRLGDLSGLALTLNELGALAHWHSDYRQACELYQAALVHYRRLRDWDSSAYTLSAIAASLQTLGDYDGALAAASESVAVLRGIGHLREIPFHLGDELAAIAYDSGDYAQASALLAEARSLVLEFGDPGDYVAGTEFFLANIVRAQGDPAQAVGLVEAILPFLTAHGHVWWTAYSQWALGAALRDLGELDRARAVTEASLAWFQSKGRGMEATHLLLQLAGIARRQGDDARVAHLLGQSLRYSQSTGQRPLLAICLAEAAYRSSALTQARGSRPEAEHAARLLGAFEALCHDMRLPIPPADKAMRAEYERALLNLRGLLGVERLDAIRAEGAGLGSEQAVSLALAGLERTTE